MLFGLENGIFRRCKTSTNSNHPQCSFGILNCLRHQAIWSRGEAQARLVMLRASLPYWPGAGRKRRRYWNCWRIHGAHETDHQEDGVCDKVHIRRRTAARTFQHNLVPKWR